MFLLFFLTAVGDESSKFFRSLIGRRYDSLDPTFPQKYKKTREEKTGLGTPLNVRETNQNLQTVYVIIIFKKVLSAFRILKMFNGEKPYPSRCRKGFVYPF